MQPSGKYLFSNNNRQRLIMKVHIRTHHTFTFNYKNEWLGIRIIILYTYKNNQYFVLNILGKNYLMIINLY